MWSQCDAPRDWCSGWIAVTLLNVESSSVSFCEFLFARTLLIIRMVFSLVFLFIVRNKLNLSSRDTNWVKVQNIPGWSELINMYDVDFHAFILFEIIKLDETHWRKKFYVLFYVKHLSSSLLLWRVICRLWNVAPCVNIYYVRRCRKEEECFFWKLGVIKSFVKLF